MVDVEFRRVGQGSGMDLTDANRALCIRGTGRGSHVLVPPSTPSLWCVLRGGLEVSTADGPFRIPSRHFLALPAGPAPRAA